MATEGTAEAARGDMSPWHGSGRVLAWRDVGKLLRGTVEEVIDDRVWRHAAAVAYYTLFALGPFLVLLLMAAGAAGHDGGELLGPLHRLLGPSGGKALDDFVAGAAKEGPGTWGIILGGAGLVVGAVGAFAQLKEAINAIYDVERKRGATLRERIGRSLKQNLLSAGGVLALLFLLLVSTSLAGVLGAIPLAGPVIAFVAVLAGFALLFRTVPDAEVAWRDAMIGATLTTILFAAGQWILATILARTPLATAYGAAGAAMALLLWVYVCALLTFFGAAFTQVWANRHGGKVRPDADSEPRGQALARRERPS